MEDAHLAMSPPVVADREAQKDLKDLTQNRPVQRREVKTGAAICEANGVTAAKVKRAARKFQAPSSVQRPHSFPPNVPATAVSTTAPASISTSTTSSPALTNAVSKPRATLSSATTPSTIFASATATTSNTTISVATANG
ncbi:hypothetical protein SprV_0301300300 [Sparganum proliferum]